MCKTSQDEMLLKDLFSTSCKYMLTCCVEPSTTETAETQEKDRTTCPRFNNAQCTILRGKAQFPSLINDKFVRFWVKK